MEKGIPKDLIREYTTPEGRKVREVGPMVYWYSMIVGADGKPRIREFGNVKPSRLGFGGFTKPEKNAAFFAVPVKNIFLEHAGGPIRSKL